uniref:Uncharacterized protein n=1 Tax=Arundo donax TaxID=35708 RepID=A0A0A9B1L6_ARUDO
MFLPLPTIIPITFPPSSQFLLPPHLSFIPILSWWCVERNREGNRREDQFLRGGRHGRGEREGGSRDP